MAVWKKVVLVALVAVVGLVPAFAQLSYAQAAPVQQASVTLPQGPKEGNWVMRSCSTPKGSCG